MKASNAYGAVRPVVGAREQEAIALRLAARKLREAVDRRSRGKALRLNHELWTLLLRDLAGENNRLPPVLKRDCVALAVFSLDYSTRAVLSDIPVEPLAAVNDRVAEGLEAMPAASPPLALPIRPAALIGAAPVPVAFSA